MVNFRHLSLPAAHIRHPADVARLRRILNIRGFEASDSDIQTAYTDWSEREKACVWYGLTDDEDVLFRILMGGLEPTRKDDLQ